MRIVFLCGSLEPGRDGVGDYTRRLAGELIRQGNEVGAIALNDFHIAEQYTGLQDAEGVDLLVLRLPSIQSSTYRFKIAKQWVRDFDPLWLSLQFVPFAFHQKGLPFSLPANLVELGKGRKWHIMFHELWVGMAKNSSKKIFIWGWVQKQLIHYTISRIAPLVIHSHTQIYIQQIGRMGFKAFQLPLFSNIPVFSLLNYQSTVTTNPSPRKTISFIIFGTVHPGAPVEEFSKEAFIYGKNNNISLKLIMIGRSGSQQSYWAQRWTAAGLTVEELGEQPPQMISNVLRQASIGITNNPIYLVEKSGTVAAMREHGLPILCVSPKWFPREAIHLDSLPGITEYQCGNLDVCLNKLMPYTHSSNLSNIAQDLLRSLIEEDSLVNLI